MGIPHRTRSLQAAALVVLASAGLIADAPAASASTLTASVTCETYPLGFDCDGFASGGTGGYTFTWSRPTASRTDTATSSSAVFACPRGTTGTVTFTVQDSSGATARQSASVVCGGHVV